MQGEHLRLQRQSGHLLGPQTTHQGLPHREVGVRHVRCRRPHGLRPHPLRCVDGHRLQGRSLPELGLPILRLPRAGAVGSIQPEPAGYSNSSGHRRRRQLGWDAVTVVSVILLYSSILPQLYHIAIVDVHVRRCRMIAIAVCVRTMATHRSRRHQLFGIINVNLTTLRCQFDLPLPRFEPLLLLLRQFINTVSTLQPLKIILTFQILRRQWMPTRITARRVRR
mmetsp:Transcript_16193/g.44863  ORF Transcript_16193/g.44863 Transcript_16193/m.44863 type:complete len:223 (-) Transcript_16193:294-962(-)